MRTFVLAASILTFVAAPALAQAPASPQADPQGRALSQPLAQQSLPPVNKPPKNNSVPALDRIGTYLQQVSQQLQTYSAQQKANPQNLAMAQVLQMQVEHMRTVTAIVRQQSLANNSLSPAERTKIQSMKQTAENLAPKVALQKQASDRALTDQQMKLDAAIKKADQTEKTKAGKDQSQLVIFQLGLMQVRAQLDAFMLSEMDD